MIETTRATRSCKFTLCHPSVKTETWSVFQGCVLIGTIEFLLTMPLYKGNCIFFFQRTFYTFTLILHSLKRPLLQKVRELGLLAQRVELLVCTAVFPQRPPLHKENRERRMDADILGQDAGERRKLRKIFLQDFTRISNIDSVLSALLA